MTASGRGRMAAVLFTDLVGSTELLSRLGEMPYDGLRRAHFAALREAIGRSGGAEVKTTGDGLLASFSSAADAVGCAVRMQQAVDVHSRTAGVPLSIRVGLSVGDVSFEDGDVFGTPVVEAARLVAAAEGGQILATSVVRAIAGGRAEARFADLGCLKLKGLPAPVSTCEVAWEPLPRSPLCPCPPSSPTSGARPPSVFYRRVSVEGHAYIKDTGVVKYYDAEDFFIRRLQVSPSGVDVKGAHDSMSYSSPAVGNESYVKVNVQADWQGDLSVNVNVSVNLQVWDGDKIDVERTDYHNVPNGWRVDHHRCLRGEWRVDL